MGAQISLWDLAFNSLECIPRNGIAGSYGNSMFNFLRICHRVFYRSCSILQSYHLLLNFLYSGHPYLGLSLYFLFLWVPIHPLIGTLPSFYVVICQILIHSFNKRHVHWVLLWVERNRSKQTPLQLSQSSQVSPFSLSISLSSFRLYPLLAPSPQPHPYTLLLHNGAVLSHSLFSVSILAVLDLCRGMHGLPLLSMSSMARGHST